MIGVEIVSGGVKNEKKPNLRDRIVQSAFEHGLLILGCGKNAIRIVPPLVISKQEMDEGLDILKSVIEDTD